MITGQRGGPSYQVGEGEQPARVVDQRELGALVLQAPLQRVRGPMATAPTVVRLGSPVPHPVRRQLAEPRREQVVLPRHLRQDYSSVAPQDRIERGSAAGTWRLRRLRSMTKALASRPNRDRRAEDRACSECCPDPDAQCVSSECQLASRHQADHVQRHRHAVLVVAARNLDPGSTRSVACVSETAHVDAEGHLRDLIGGRSGGALRSGKPASIVRAELIITT